MTSRPSAKSFNKLTPLSRRSNSIYQPRRSAFTLVELMVVIVIILILAGILIPLVSKAYGRAKRTQVRLDLNTIGVALEAYKGDFGDYPRPVYVAPAVTPIEPGAVTLCHALLGNGGVAQDGADGYGFRTKVSETGAGQGKVYGPYLQPEKYRIRDAFTDPANPQASPRDPLTAGFAYGQSMLVDSYGNPILYFPARAGRLNLTIANSYVANAPLAMFNWADNGTVHANYPLNESGLVLPVGSMQKLMNARTSTAPIGAADPNMPKFDIPFVLWTAGADGQYGFLAGATTSDDVTNFDISADLIK